MKKTFKVKSKRFNIIKSVKDLQVCTSQLPTKDECFKHISAGGFSSISFILLIAKFEKIKHLYASTFRVGKKETQNLHYLKKAGKLEKATFLVSGLFSVGNKSKKYNYFEDFCGVCDCNGWEYIVKNNHSKVLLIETECNWYVIETSSNLNENPKIEQFSFENCEELFNFYKINLFET